MGVVTSLRRALRGNTLLALSAGTATLTVGGIAIPTVTYAQTAMRQLDLDIPAQDLNAALLVLTQRAGLQIVYDADKVVGRRSSAVKGRMAPIEALSRLLTGTGLSFRISGTNRITIEQAPETAESAIQLGPVRVEGQGERARGIYGRIVPQQETASSYVPSYAARISATATKIDTPILETPQSISIVTREALDTQGATNLTDALRYSAGISTAAYLNGNGDNYDIFTIRGFSNSNSGLLRDGMRLNYNSFDAPSETYGLERIEVLKGPAGVLYGQSGPSGAVNMVSKRPTTDPLHEFELQGGTFSRYQVATDHSGAIDTDGQFSYRLTALARQSGGWTDYGRNDRLYIAPAISWRPDDRTNLTLLGYYQESKSSYYPDVAREFRIP
ncbi:outer membrane receptor for ferric coprogen and ferric-rhodotorulic acid [Burkholderia sp. Ch1-1]|nr:outer membrane receptor for ferric coprogen and ferric-rhodotorulic acid [Burkholderia sp. Ch1-1]